MIRTVTWLGDEALKAVAAIITGYFKNYALCCRYGGEEFAIALMESSYDKAFEYSDKLRKLIETADIVYDGIKIPLTISAGIAIKDPDEHLTQPQLIDRADRALYKAKNEGRNKVILFTEVSG
jgi:diguanylate cyclase (GGDEF)-like protein